MFLRRDERLTSSYVMYSDGNELDILSVCESDNNVNLYYLVLAMQNKMKKIK